MQLFPIPRQVSFSGGFRNFSAARWIILPENASFPLKNRVMEMSRTLAAFFALPPEVCAGEPAAGEILVRMVRKTGIGKEGFRIAVQPEGPIRLEAASDAGFFYGMQTVCRLLRKPSRTPCCRISDHPSLEERGYMLDVSRCKVPTMETIKERVRSLAALRYNSIQLYMEHTFAFSAHERVWAASSPFTAEEIMELDGFCREYFIELVPNLNSFGHLNRWLKHPEYRSLAECDPPYLQPGIGISRQEVLHPGKESLDFMDSLYREFLPNFTSRKVNIGCDETMELGKGKSAAICRKKGVAQIYLDFLTRLTERVNRQGFSVEFWGDIILHQPDLIEKLPPGITALAWGYEADHPFEENCTHFQNAGVKYLICPGTSAWQSILGRTANMTGCIRNAIGAGCRHSARGMLMTDWGDNGHHQYDPISWPGIVMGGGCAWNAEAAEATEALLPLGISLAFAPGKEGIRLGEFLLELGTVCDDFSTRISNATPFGQILPCYPRMRKSHAGCFLNRMKAAEAAKARKHTEKLLQKFTAEPFAGFPLVNAELDNALRMALCGLTFLYRCLGGSWDQARWRDELRHVIARHEELWLCRNRSGGLYESSSFLRQALNFDPDEWKNR